MSNLMSRYYQDACKIPLLSKEQEYELADDIAAGGERGLQAWTEMVEANLRLVIKIANNFIGRGMDIADLVAWGNFGLFDAAWRFRSDKGVKFCTYAKWWIERSIRKAISEKGAMAFMRISNGLQQKALKVERYVESYIVEYGTAPTTAKISEGTGFTEKQIAILQEILLMKKVSVEEMAERDMGPAVESSYRDIETRDDIELLRMAMDKLEPRMRTIINHRFAIAGAPHKTLKELNVMFNITSERVRQIEEDAKKELRKICEELETENAPL